MTVLSQHGKRRTWWMIAALAVVVVIVGWAMLHKPLPRPPQGGAGRHRRHRVGVPGRRTDLPAGTRHRAGLLHRDVTARVTVSCSGLRSPKGRPCTRAIFWRKSIRGRISRLRPGGGHQGQGRSSARQCEARLRALHETSAQDLAASRRSIPSARWSISWPRNSRWIRP